LHIEDQAGQVVWWADHVEPYGALTVHPRATIAYPLRFPGHYLDEETGLCDNRHRSYSPRLGRYLQSDPLGQSGGVNLQAYAPNPLVQVDVLGLMCKTGGKTKRKRSDDTEAGIPFLWQLPPGLAFPKKEAHVAPHALAPALVKGLHTAWDESFPHGEAKE